MEHFSYEGGYGICALRRLKAERALATDKLLQVISLFKTVIATTKKLKPF